MNISTYLKERKYNGLDDEEKIRDDLFKKDISVSYEKTNDDNTRRFIFTSSQRSRKNTAYINDLYLEANGLILESPSWRPLVVSPLSPKNTIDTKVINNIIRNKMYNIYYLEDGTPINLYFYKPKNNWVIATSKGIDVGNNIFNTLKYQQMLDESLEKIGQNPQDFYKSLSKDHCYSLGFKHPDLHPFREARGSDIYKVWFIQSVKIDAIIEKCQVNKESTLTIPNHTMVPFDVPSINTLFSRLKSSYDDFIDNNETKTIYGFMLVAKDGVLASSADYSTVILESRLMSFIRKLWYDASYAKVSRNQAYNRMKTVLLVSYLDDNRSEYFRTLFPQFVDELELLNEGEVKIIDKIYANISEAANTDKVANTGVSANTGESANTTGAKNTDDIIEILSKQVTKLLTISSHERPKQKIRDIIHNTENLDYYYNHQHNQ